MFPIPNRFAGFAPFCSKKCVVCFFHAALGGVLSWWGMRSGQPVVAPDHTGGFCVIKHFPLRLWHFLKMGGMSFDIGTVNGSVCLAQETFGEGPFKQGFDAFHQVAGEWTLRSLKIVDFCEHYWYTEY